MSQDYGTPITPPTEDVPPMPPPPAPMPAPAPKSNRTTWIIVAVVVVVLCCCLILAVVAWFTWDPIMNSINNGTMAIPSIISG